MPEIRDFLGNPGFPGISGISGLHPHVKRKSRDFRVELCVFLDSAWMSLIFPRWMLGFSCVWCCRVTCCDRGLDPQEQDVGTVL